MGIGLSVHREERTAVGQTLLGAAFEGAPGRAHGGIVAALIDEVMGHVLPIEAAVAYTASLTINYTGPAPIGVPLEFRAWLRERDTRKLWIDAAGTVDGTEFVRAHALFLCIEPSRFAR
jgi:acyl-coenzyme A thioesterase PaaI-like protein